MRCAYRSLITAALASAVALPACTRPSEDRVLADMTVGDSRAAGAHVQVQGGLAAVRSITPGRIELWSQSPVLDLTVTLDAGGAAAWTVVFRNVPGDAEITGEQAGAPLRQGDRRVPSPTVVEQVLELSPGAPARLHLASPDAAERGRFRFGVLSDVQEAIEEFHEVVTRMNQETDLRFFVSTGDLTRRGSKDELLRFQEVVLPLEVPFYSTVGNHENGADAADWAALFGRSNFTFSYRQSQFSFIDSSNATVDPTVYDWLDGWLALGAGGTHAVLSHVPCIDPIGERNGSFRNRNEGAKLSKRLADGKVDALFFGHIHSYYAFSAAGIPTFISGGGGAIPERLDGIGRHYLTCTADPDRGITDVALVRVD